MKIDCISDLHGYRPKLPGGDLLIIAGDITARDEHDEWLVFFDWLKSLEYKKIIFIAGNHDNYMEDKLFISLIPHLEYLYDSGTEYEGLKIWGSPWTLRFAGQNPDAAAFGLYTESQMEEKYALIPDNTEILITHSPANNVLDHAPNQSKCFYAARFGSFALANRIMKLPHLKYHIHGHIHEGHGCKEVQTPHGIYTAMNVSHVNERYKNINPYQEIII
jgi:Icc-related predicted phosphoesterase